MRYFNVSCCADAPVASRAMAKKDINYPLAELNKRIFKSANRFVVNVVYILKDCKCTYFP